MTLTFPLFLPSSSGAADPALDPTWLEADLWNDGQAEIAFYQVERQRDQYGRQNAQSFLLGTYLVKHDFDPLSQSKASSGSGVPAFKQAFFYEFVSGSYQYKRSYVTNSALAGLAPLKMSFNSFDWCSNLYRELAFLPAGEVESLVRSDDYGNAAGSFARPEGSFVYAQLPLLVRGLDFSSNRQQNLLLVDDRGRAVAVRVELLGREDVTVAAGTLAAEKIAVTYESEVPSLVGERSARVEHYWRGMDEGRLLLRVEAGDGRYRIELIEQLRSAYWRENVYQRLEEVAERP